MAASDDIRCGRVRGSMKTNALLQKIEVARVCMHVTVFSN